jgi:hypothetical protein
VVVSEMFTDVNGDDLRALSRSVPIPVQHHMLISPLIMTLQVAVKVIKFHASEEDLKVRSYTSSTLYTVPFRYTRESDEKLQYGHASSTRTLSLF